MPPHLEERIPDSTAMKVLVGWKRWLPIYVYRVRSGWKVQVFPLQMTVWTLLLLVSTYLGAGTALFLNDTHRHNLTGISWFDRIYPPNWDKYREARGDSYITQAQDSIKSGDFSKSFHQVRAGLARSPHNLGGRLQLADMYQAMGLGELAQNTLVEGTRYHFNEIPYMRRAIHVLFSQQKDSDIVKLSDSLLSNEELGSESEQLLRIAKANALFFRGNFDQTEDTLSDEHISKLPESRLLQARIEWDRGFPELALALIEQLNIEFPKNLEIYRHQIQWLIADGQIESARQTSFLRRIRYPDQAQPRIDLLYAFDKAGEEITIENDARSLLRDFHGNYAVLLQLGDFAANTGRVDIAQQVVAHAAQQNMALEGPALMVVEAMITAGDYRSALDQTQQTLTDNPEWKDKLAPVFNGLQAICYHALGEREEANLFLGNYLSLDSLRAENLVAVSKRLDDVGASREARMVLDHAVQRDSLNQAALTRLIEFDLNSANAPELPSNLRQIMNMRRPPTTLLRQAYDKVGQDRFMFVEDRNQLMQQLLAKLTG